MVLKRQFIFFIIKEVEKDICNNKFNTLADAKKICKCRKKDKNKWYA